MEERLNVWVVRSGMASESFTLMQQLFEVKHAVTSYYSQISVATVTSCAHREIMPLCSTVLEQKLA